MKGNLVLLEALSDFNGWLFTFHQIYSIIRFWDSKLAATQQHHLEKHLSWGNERRWQEWKSKGKWRQNQSLLFQSQLVQIKSWVFPLSSRPQNCIFHIFSQQAIPFTFASSSCVHNLLKRNQISKMWKHMGRWDYSRLHLAWWAGFSINYLFYFH